MHKHLPLLLAALLAGCGSLAPGAAGRLSALDPLAADPATLSLAAVMPAPTRLRSGDVRLKMTLEAPSPDGVAEEFALDVDTSGQAIGVVVNPASERLQVLKIASADFPRLRAAQDKVRAYKASGGEGKGSISVSIGGGCIDGPVGAGPLIAAVYMRTSPADGYFAMLKPLDLRKLAGEDAIAKLPNCA